MSTDYQSAAEKQKAVRFSKDFPALERVEQVYQDQDYTATYHSDEFNSVCHKTGLPDFASLDIEYKPDRYLVELKSLKIYLNAFRNVGIFQEHACNKVFEDFWKTAEPKYLKVTMNFGARGGIGTKIVVERYQA